MRSFINILALAAASAPATLALLTGADVSHYQGTINWASVKSAGASFVYIKATESTSVKDAQFNANYVGAYNAGLIRGAYHFAHPDASSGAAQANYFVSNGGGWSADGATLPGAVDLEGTCYGLSSSGMVSWISDFSNTYHSLTSRWPVIYTSTSWWTSCTGNSAAFAANSPLWVARYSSAVGTLPAGWGYYTFWQHADSGSLPGDQDYFNGAASGLSNLARG